VSRTIPERMPIGDTADGFLLRLPGHTLFCTEHHPDAEVIASGSFTVRYGLRFLGKLYQSIVPGLVVMDYGDILTGEKAWHFLLKRSNLHPRAEVVGYRNDGSDDMCFLRVLDMAVPPEVLIYANASDIKPLAKPTALIAAHPGTLPERLTTYLPTYTSIADWQNAAYE
jgi:hypothetical protein